MDAEDKHYYAKWGNALSYPITYVMNDTETSPASAVTPNAYTGEDKKPVIEPTPQQNADTLNRGNALSQDGGKRATNRGTAVGTNKGRLPKTGEVPFALNFAGTAAGFLLAAYAVLGRRRKEQ